MIEIFDLLEFQILAAARQMKSYYGFQAENEPRLDEVCFAVYQLTRRGILKQQGEELLIQEPIAGYMSGIAAAHSLIVIDRGQYKLPRQCVYYDERKNVYLCLENSSTDKERICLSKLTEYEMFLQLEDLEQLPACYQREDREKENIFAYWHRMMPARLKVFLENGLKTETESLLEQEYVHTIFSKRERKTGNIMSRMILLSFPVGYCQVLQNGNNSVQIKSYEQKNAEKLLKKWWRK